MTDDRHLDGNALAGVLNELFGREMTEQVGCCGHCGAANALGAVHVYLDAPGHVIRCPNCSTVLIVIVHHPDGVRVNFESIRWLQTHS
jgi:DNA-directed RNA polymerase subunit RPC12/RpoP